jgi:hypothetical protein
MNVIAFITLLQEHPMAGFGMGLAFFVLMFMVKNGIVYLYSRDFEKAKGRNSGGD